MGSCSNKQLKFNDIIDDIEDTTKLLCIITDFYKYSKKDQRRIMLIFEKYLSKDLHPPELVRV
jgi:hypothetical protein